jgi:uncharacterized protein DUF3152
MTHPQYRDRRSDRDVEPPRRSAPYQGPAGSAPSRPGRPYPDDRRASSGYDRRGHGEARRGHGEDRRYDRDDRYEGSSRLEAGRIARARSRHRRRRSAILTVLAIAGMLIGIDIVRGHAQNAPAAGSANGANSSASTHASSSASAAPSASASPSPLVTPSYPVTGPGTFTYATTPASPIMGTAGTLHRFRVAVENGTGSDANQFAAKAEQILSDPRSWIAGGDVHLQRVDGAASGYNFTVYLVTPGTAYKICLAGGYDIFWRGEPYTSCRVGGKVVINITRYLHSVPGYGASLEAYQQYAINHEVGHALGHDHELCPGKGKLAPVMQQQTFSLQGCVAYSWPYLDGKRYAGPPGRIAPPGESAPHPPVR